MQKGVLYFKSETQEVLGLPGVSLSSGTKELRGSCVQVFHCYTEKFGLLRSSQSDTRLA